MNAVQNTQAHKPKCNSNHINNYINYMPTAQTTRAIASINISSKRPTYGYNAAPTPCRITNGFYHLRKGQLIRIAHNGDQRPYTPVAGHRRKEINGLTLTLSDTLERRSTALHYFAGHRRKEINGLTLLCRTP